MKVCEGVRLLGHRSFWDETVRNDTHVYDNLPKQLVRYINKDFIFSTSIFILSYVHV